MKILYLKTERNEFYIDFPDLWVYVLTFVFASWLFLRIIQ
jgi:hypothetical protein